MNEKNTNECRKLIKNLNTSEDVKKILSKINTVVSSNNPKMKQSVKDLFIVSPSCEELSKIARCYERIITANFVYPNRGTRTYLELAFPLSNNKDDYKAFFASPRIASATQNYFSGVFLVSFEQWKSYNELSGTIAFMDLIQFISVNNRHISFVFHVTPEFNNINKLYNKLTQYLNIYRVEHFLPDMKTAIQYIENQLGKAGIGFDDSGRREIKRLIEEKVDVSSNFYHGYKTLDKLAFNIKFELYANISERQVDNNNSSYIINKDDIQMIASSIESLTETENLYKKIGFC